MSFRPLNCVFLIQTAPAVWDVFDRSILQILRTPEVSLYLTEIEIDLPQILDALLNFYEAL